MRLKVLYFAAVRDLVGLPEESVELDGRTIGDFATFLAGHRPVLAGRLGPVRFARNEEFVRAGDPIADGDVIALIPPVAGG